MKKVYLLLHWFWEGDGYLIPSVLLEKDCLFDTEQKAKEYAIAHDKFKSRIYGVGEEIPKEDDYLGHPFLQIREIEVK